MGSGRGVGVGVLAVSYVKRLMNENGTCLHSLLLRKLVVIQASDDADRIIWREMIQD